MKLKIRFGGYSNVKYSLWENNDFDHVFGKKWEVCSGQCLSGQFSIHETAQAVRDEKRDARAEMVDTGRPLRFFLPRWSLWSKNLIRGKNQEQKKREARCEKREGRSGLTAEVFFTSVVFVVKEPGKRQESRGKNQSLIVSGRKESVELYEVKE